MDKVFAAIARQCWAQTRDVSRHEPVGITSHGRTTAVVVDPDLAKRAMDAVEEIQYIAAAQAALQIMADGEPTISLDNIAQELGLSENV